jgi:hypothetical protein
MEYSKFDFLKATKGPMHADEPVGRKPGPDFQWDRRTRTWKRVGPQERERNAAITQKTQSLEALKRAMGGGA